MNVIKMLLEKQLKHRIFSVFLLALFVNALFGFINMTVNYSVVTAHADDLNIPVIVMYAFVPFVSLLSIIASVFSMSLITYFLAAFWGFGFNYQSFVKLSARCCAWIPLMTLIDTLQFIMLGKRMVSDTILGLIFYLPFYFLIYCSVSAYTPQYVPVDKKKMQAFSIVVTALMIIATYPSNAY